MSIFNKKKNEKNVSNNLKKLIFTLLENNQIFGDNQLEIIKKMGTKAALTDYAILTGAYVSDNYTVDDDSTLKGRTGGYWTKTPYESEGYAARLVTRNGIRDFSDVGYRDEGARPALSYSSILEIPPERSKGTNKEGVEVIEYGYYPQDAVDASMQSFLTNNEHSLVKRNFHYSADSKKDDAYGEDISLRENEVYEYNGKLYAKVIANTFDEEFTLSNGVKYKRGDVVWVEVSPIRWLHDKKNKVLLSERILFGGIPFNHIGIYDGKFENTDLYKYMNEYFSREIMQAVFLKDKDVSSNTIGDVKLFNIDDNLENDIKNLLNNIEALLNNVPEEIKNNIIEKINSLLTDYIIAKKKLKPSFIKKRNILELPGTSLKSIKTNLLADLEIIKLNLSSNEIFNFLRRLDNYKSLVNNPKKEINKNDEVEIAIIDIINLINSFDEGRKKIYISLLNTYIDSSIKKANDELKDINSNKLVVNYENNERDFKNNVFDLHDKLKLLDGKYRPLKDLYDCFNSNNIEITAKDKDDLNNDIITINYIISKINNTKYKKIISDSYNNIKETYLSKIKKILEDDKLLIKSNFDDIEFAIRKDINTFLENSKEYIFMDDYESKNVNKERLKDELEKAIEFVDNNEENDNDSNIIISMIIDIYGLLNDNSSVIEEIDLKGIKEEIKIKLSKSIEDIENKKIDNLEDYTIELKKILNKVAKIKVDVVSFINEKKRYYDITNIKNK